MKKLLVSTWSVRATAAVVFLVGLAAGARGNPSTVGVSYVDCLGDPNCTVAQLSSSDKAGVDPYIAYNWNTVLTAAGVQTNLIRDDLGVASVTNATVLWSATNTWSSTGRGEENNNFVGADRVLMTGYLDQNTLTPSPTFIQIRDIPADMALNYDVVIYTLGGVPNRGGEYAVNGLDRKFVVASGDGSLNGPQFQEAIGDDPNFGFNDWGNYVVFRGLSGSTVTITAINTFGDTPRAPINAIQIASFP